MPKKMKIAFVDPSPSAKFYTTAAIDPLSLCYLAAMAKNTGCKVKIFQQLDEPTDKFLKRLILFGPDVCAFSVYTSTLKHAIGISKKLKKELNCITYSAAIMQQATRQS